MATERNDVPQQKTRAARQPAPPESGGKSSGSVWLIALAVLTLAAAAFHYVKLKHVSVPAELIGTWKTVDPSYKDRALEIGGESVSFSTGGGTEYTGFIDHIDSNTDKSGSFYTIYYLVNGNKNQMSLYYNSAAGGTLQFRNQPNIIWRKESSS